MKRVLIAMSGGVDSSVAAYLLLQQGYDCAGATMKLFENADVVPQKKTCCSLDDVHDAKSVAHALGIAHYTFNFAQEFKQQVIEKFVRAYQNGETPNPCIDCNRFLKFEKLLARANQLDMSYIATGHYARVEQNTDGRYLLRKAIDESKDQSYVLCFMTQKQLAATLFPLGGLTKSDSRAIAHAQGFSNAAKADSQDICFVPSGDYGTFLEQFTGQPLCPGDFIDPQGQVLGRHRGTPRYTIGQRKGLGLALPRPGYVCEINPAANTVTVGDQSRLFGTTLIARDINLIMYPQLDRPLRCKAKVRYRQEEQPATVEQLDEHTLRVTFDEPQRAITSGQAVALYDDEYVIGGGVIAQAGV